MAKLTQSRSGFFVTFMIWKGPKNFRLIVQLYAVKKFSEAFLYSSFYIIHNHQKVDSYNNLKRKSLCITCLPVTSLRANRLPVFTTGHNCCISQGLALYRTIQFLHFLLSTHRDMHKEQH